MVKSEQRSFKTNIYLCVPRGQFYTPVTDPGLTPAHTGLECDCSQLHLSMPSGKPPCPLARERRVQLLKHLPVSISGMGLRR